MKFSSGKRIGQSGQQLTTAVLFSFFLHAILFLSVLFVQFAVIPRVSMPPFYAVKLVGLPPDADVQTPSAGTQPVPQQHQVKPAPAKPRAQKRTAKPPKAAARGGALPDLSPQVKKKAVEVEPEPTEEATPAPASRQASVGGTGKSESVSPVVAQQSDFKYGWYLNQIRTKIGQNWNPPPDAPDAKARVLFSINRSGWVGEVRLDDKETRGTFQFQQAAIRAIRASNPFPELPAEYSKQRLDFSVDLTAVQ